MCGALGSLSEEETGEGRGGAGAAQGRAPSWTTGALEHLPQGWFHTEGKGPCVTPGVSVTVWGLPGLRDGRRRGHLPGEASPV